MAMPNVIIQQAATTGQRVIRSPQHRWQVRSEPYVIQPIMIAPVIPGETLKRGTIKARVVGDPIVNPLIGWWKEYYFFYVKIRDLAGREDFTEMCLDMNKDMSAYYSAADVKYYHNASATPDAVNWTKLCLQRVVEKWFRDEGETWDTQSRGGVPLSQVKQPHWLHSVVEDTQYASTDVATDDTGATAGELERARQQWEFMRMANMTDMDYDQFLATFGVRMGKEEPHKPEILRYLREWTYPTNHIDPTDGSPSSACSWVIDQTIDKDRAFKEHGFILGVTVCRPKVYFQRQYGAGAHMFDNALAWMPAIMREDPYTSMRKYTAGTGPLKALTDDYWVDLRDVLVHGDQFINFSVTETDANGVLIPTAANEKRYVSDASVDALFVDAVGGNNLIREDGVVSLHILGTQIDQTPKAGS